MEVDNKYSSNEFDTIVAKKSRKDMIDTWFNKKLNKSEAKFSQSTYQTNINASGSTLFALQKSKHYITNTFVRETRKKKLLSVTKICNFSKNLLSKRTKVIRKYKIATFINNIVKKHVNIYKLQIELIEYIIKFLVNIYSYNKYFLLDKLKLLRDKRNVPIFLSLIGKI